MSCEETISSLLLDEKQRESLPGQLCDSCFGLGPVFFFFFCNFALFFMGDKEPNQSSVIYVGTKKWPQQCVHRMFCVYYARHVSFDKCGKTAGGGLHIITI